MTQENRSDAAVSETVGFILMFSIVILSMSMIYILGFPILQEHIESSVFENAQQSFFVLQSDMKRVAFEQVPVKTMKIKLHSSTLSIDDSSSIEIKYNGAYTNDIKKYDTGNIEFIKNENILTYENGGLWMKQHPSGSIMVSKPSIYTGTVNDENMTTIGVISVQGRRSTSGNGIASINMEHNSSDLIRSSEKVDVNIEINSPYSKQWSRYLEENGFDIINSNSSSVSAKRLQTWLIVSSHKIDVSLI